jgi:hypothetical protein
MSPVDVRYLAPLIFKSDARILAPYSELRQLAESLACGERLTKMQADLLFATNFLLRKHLQHQGWQELFADALAGYLLRDAPLNRDVAPDKARRLMEKILSEGEVSDTELECLVRMTDRASRTPHFIRVFVLNALRARVQREERITEPTLALIERFVLGDGDEDGSRLPMAREEANFLFQLNADAAGCDNAPRWQELYLDALTWHVLHDPKTPGRLDDVEASWLVRRIRAMKTIDESTRELLRRICSRAKYIPAYLDETVQLYAA